MATDRLRRPRDLASVLVVIVGDRGAAPKRAPPHIAPWLRLFRLAVRGAEFVVHLRERGGVQQVVTIVHAVDVGAGLRRSKVSRDAVLLGNARPASFEDSHTRRLRLENAVEVTVARVGDAARARFGRHLMRARKHHTSDAATMHEQQRERGLTG